MLLQGEKFTVQVSFDEKFLVSSGTVNFTS
jgi:hypothetical protein